MRRDALYIADLVESTRTVRDYLDGIRREQWDGDRVLRDAVLYRLLLLGEIASALPDLLRDRYPDVAWRQIRAFRNLAGTAPCLCDDFGRSADSSPASPGLIQSCLHGHGLGGMVERKKRPGVEREPGRRARAHPASLSPLSG
jgi:hypothetical protein